MLRESTSLPSHALAQQKTPTTVYSVKRVTTINAVGVISPLLTVPPLTSESGGEADSIACRDYMPNAIARAILIF